MPSAISHSGSLSQRGACRAIGWAAPASDAAAAVAAAEAAAGWAACGFLYEEARALEGEGPCRAHRGETDAAAPPPAPIREPGDGVFEGNEEDEHGSEQRPDLRGLGVGPVQPVFRQIADAVATGGGLAHEVAPKRRQQRAGAVPHEVLGEERMA